MDYKLLGENIRKYRKAKNLTILQLSEMIDVSESFCGQIERSKNKASLQTLVKIANKLEVSLDSLVFNSLDANSGKNHFLNEVEKLTKDLTSAQKTIILEDIELLKRFSKNS